MNDEPTPEYHQPAENPFVPLLLTGLSVAFIFLWQVINTSQQRSAFITAHDQLENAFTSSTPQHEQLIQQSKTVQAKLEKLVNELLDLAEAGDADAKAIVGKYKIERKAPASAATASPSPASSPAK